MRRIAIINQKGGVGKTTTTVNLCAAIAEAGLRTCLVDLDPQAHATLHLGVTPKRDEPSVYDVLTQSMPLAAARVRVDDHLWLVGSDIDLAAAELELAGVVGRELILRDRLRSDGEPFDYVFIDCPPSLGVLTINALAAVDEVLIPLQPHFLALHGLSKLLETIALVAERLNPALRVTGIVYCMYDTATRLAAEVERDVDAFLERSRHEPTPWQEARAFATRIRRNIRLAEAPSFGQSVLRYAANCNGSIDYRSLAEEVIAQDGACGERWSRQPASSLGSES